MKQIGRNILKSINEGYWLDINYKNKDNERTRYWIAIKRIIVSKKILVVEAFNLNKNKETLELTIYYDSILSAKIIEGTYIERNEKLIEDIKINPDKYDFLARENFNFRILDYFSECYRLDVQNYQSNFSLINKLDDDELTKEQIYNLSDLQFIEIIENFQKRLDFKQYNFIELCLSRLSFRVKKGLYVLAYRKFNLDLKNKRLIPDKEIILNREFRIGGLVYNITKFLGEDDQNLLEDFEKNKKIISEKIAEYNKDIYEIDESPNIFYLERDFIIDLNYEYQGIFNMYANQNISEPIRAFFGEVKSPSLRRKNWPIVLLNKDVNIDQILSIHSAMKYPLTYVQGPPGTGKTWTIVNVVITAFFNEKTVLIASSNNHPLDGIYNQLRNIYYKQNQVLFPVIRLGNKEIIRKTIIEIKKMLELCRSINIFESTLNKNRTKKKEQTQKLTEVLKLYEESQDLKERRSIIEKMIDENHDRMFRLKLEDNLQKVNLRLSQIGEIKNEDALNLLDDDENEFLKYLYFTSAKYLKRLNEPKYSDFMAILEISDEEKRIIEFNRYLSNSENLKLFMRVFPIIITTNISASRLGMPEPVFDLTIIDEAGQCNPATSLVSIVRGHNLMLLGDPQQLGPVNVLDIANNEILKEKYKISEEYDYLKNSIYTIYEIDVVSRQILLSYHYRSNKKIIGFNNKKFYENRLKIRSKSKEEKPLVFVDIKDPFPSSKNTSVSEAEAITAYIKENPNYNIGVITPFVKQKELIEKSLKDQGLYAEVGTIHAFQGDEKDIILFSSAITDQMSFGTYNWVKGNKELINVAVSRAKEKFVLYASREHLLKLSTKSDDDFYDLYQYIKTNGESEVKTNSYPTRALGFRPYSSETEKAFMETLGHALSICDTNCFVREEVPIKSVFQKGPVHNSLFYTGQFDFVVYRKYPVEYPIIIFELNGPEHKSDERVMRRDEKKDELAKAHNLKIVKVKNSYARRYNYIKQILVDHFRK